MRILLVEEDLGTAATIGAFTERTIAVDHAVTTDDAIGLGLEHRYDAVVVDRTLPDGDGLFVVEQLRSMKVSAPMVVLGGGTTSQARVDALNGGATVWLDKPCGFDLLHAQIQALTRAPSASPLVSQELGDLSLDLLLHQVSRAGRKIPLLPREFQLLRELMRTPGQSVTRAHLWKVIWGFGFDPGTSVLEVHISRLRNKIDGGFPAPMIQTVRGVGYRLVDPAVRSVN